MTGEPMQTTSKASRAQLSSEKQSSHYALLLTVFNPSVRIEKYLCNQSSQYEISPLQRGSHHVQPLNQHLSLSAKMNRTQRRALDQIEPQQCQTVKKSSS